MGELIGFVAGMVVLMLLLALLPHVFELPDVVAKYFHSRARRAEAGPPPRDADETAARILGESLRRAQLSPQASAQVTAVFWAAEPHNRRALAHLVAGLSADGPIEDEANLLAMLSSLRAAPERPLESDKKLPTSTSITERPGCAI
jgi:hypothetical protein